VGKIYKKFLTRSYIGVEEAVKLISEPKKGGSKTYIKKTKADKSPGPTSKRARMSDPGTGPSETGTAKFSCNSKHSVKILASSKQYSEESKNLLSAAYSASTWNTINSAVNCFSKFTGSDIAYSDINQNVVNNFVWWCHKQNLKYSTIKSYLGCLTIVLKLLDKDSSALDSYLTKVHLRGVRNIEATTISSCNKRHVITFELLLLIGNELSKSEWSEDTIRVLWCLCCTLFFGSFRIGELLPCNESYHDTLTTLLWKDITFLGNCARIHIRFPKVFSASGVKIDIFEFKGFGCCPVTCLREFKKKRISENISLDENSPVFRFSSGINLTAKKFNEILRYLIEPIVKEKSVCFSSHSFRAAIPSILACNPDIASNADIMCWGRWDSDAYLRYTKLKRQQRENTFKKICSIIHSQESRILWESSQ